jgi:hypothetical protein
MAAALGAATLTEQCGAAAMASTHNMESYSGGQSGGERRRLPRRQWRRLPTKAVGTPALLTARGARQQDSTCHATWPTISDRRAQAEEMASDKWVRLYFIISKLFNHPNFEI